MLNKVTLIGRLGGDPEVRHFPSGGSVTNITLATNSRWRDKQSGEKKESTEWHRVVFFNRLAEIAAEYLKKGAQVYVEGRLQTRKWQDQTGQERYTTEIVAQELHMLGGRQDGGTASFVSDQSQSEYAAPPPSRPAYSNQTAAPQQSSMPPAPPPQAYDDFDDDIPF